MLLQNKPGMWVSLTGEEFAQAKELLALRAMESGAKARSPG